MKFPILLTLYSLCSAIALAARLKALGVESVMVERNAKPGDNWALRYDCMRFHTPTSYCDLPYMPYDKELRAPHLLRRDELVTQVRRYVDTFNLNFITSAQIQSTQYDPLAKRWTVIFQTPAGQRKAISRHLVLATGVGCQKLNMPSIANSQLYQGINLHSTQFQNGKRLKEQGAKVSDIPIYRVKQANHNTHILVRSGNRLCKHRIRRATRLSRCRNPDNHDHPESPIPRPRRIRRQQKQRRRL